MPTPTGSDLRVNYQFEKADQQPAPPFTRSFEPRSASGYRSKRPLERNDALTPYRQNRAGVNVVAPIAPKFAPPADVDTLVDFLAHIQRKVAIINPTAGVYQWDMQPWVRGDAEPASYIDSLAFDIDDGDGKPILLTGNRLQEIAFKIASGKIQACDMSFLGCYETYQSDVAPIAVNAAFTGRILVRGHRLDPDSANNVKIKCTTAGGSGVAQIKMTVGATAYGATAYTVTYGQWIRVKDAAGARVGLSHADDLWIMFLDAAGGGSVLTLNDEWQFTNTRTVATPAASLLQPLHCSGVDLTLDGVDFTFHEAELKVVRPRKANMVNRKYAESIQDNGNVMLQIAISRDYKDRSALKKLLSSGTIAANIDMTGNQIGATVYDELLRFNAGYMQVADDANDDVANANTRQEKILLEAVRVGANPLFTSRAICTRATL